MKISIETFERELDSLILAAKSASNKDTARSYLKEADNKIDGYDNIPSNLKNKYRLKITTAEQELGL